MGQHFPQQTPPELTSLNSTLNKEQLALLRVKRLELLRFNHEYLKFTRLPFRHTRFNFSGI